MRELFETDCEVFFVFNGTAANALALAQICRPYHAVIAHALSHIEEDEAGAPAPALRRRQDRHGRHPARQADARRRRRAGGEGPRRAPRQAPRPVDHAGHRARHRLHARRGRGAHRGGAPPRPHGAHGRRALRQCGGGISAARRPICPGAPASTCCASAGSRTGSRWARPCCSSTATLAQEFEWRVKQAGHLNSKMRLVTAPWLALLESDVWLDNARHANAMATRLWERIARLRGRAADGAGAVERGVRRAAGGGAGERCASAAGGSTPSSARPAAA